MARRSRIDQPGAIHHVMNRGVDHGITFFDDLDRVEFGARLAAIHERFGVETLAYCLMSTHYHLLVRTPTARLSQAMHHLGLTYTRHTNDRHGRDGPLFRGRYHSIQVTTERYLMWVSRYIHRNALDVADVSTPAAYRWSSYRSYLGLRPAPPFLNQDLVLEQFGNDRHRLARFTEADDPRAYADPISSIPDLLQFVQLAVAQDDLAHGDDVDVGRQLLDRTALVLLCDRLTDPVLRTALVEHLDFPSPAARRMARHRASARATDPGIQRILAALRDDFGGSFAA